MELNTSKIIFNQINNAIAAAADIYGMEYVFGSFTLGEDNKTYVLIIPTFDDLVVNSPLINKNLDNNILCLDIRFIYRATQNGFPELIYALYTDYYIINPNYEHIYLKLFRAKRDLLKEGVRIGDPAPELKLALYKLLRAALNNNSNTIKFIKHLTDIEKLVLEELVNQIGDEGFISQYKLSSSLGVSKRTVSTLIDKMQAYEVAVAEKCGSKGTYIKILEDTLLDIRSFN